MPIIFMKKNINVVEILFCWSYVFIHPLNGWTNGTTEQVHIPIVFSFDLLKHIFFFIQNARWNNK